MPTEARLRGRPRMSGRCTNGAAAPTAHPITASSQLRLQLPIPPQSGRLRCLENCVAGWVVGVAALI